MGKELKPKNEYVPTKFDAFWDKIVVYIMPLLTLIGDFVAIYASVYVILDPLIPWIWVFPILAVSIPVLYFFNKGSYEMINDEIKKKKEK